MGRRRLQREHYTQVSIANLDLDTSLWHKIQRLPKVSRFIGEGKNATPLSDADIKVILDKMENRSGS